MQPAENTSHAGCIRWNSSGDILLGISTAFVLSCYFFGTIIELYLYKRWKIQLSGSMK
jgi:hypothetical protein